MTRYPKSGKGKKWTQKELESVPAEWAGDSLSDGDGLTGEVRAGSDGTVSAVFRFGFKWEGRKARFYCGAWPTVTLAEVRSRRDAARLHLKAGVNPSDHRKAERIESQAKVTATIADAAREAADNLPFKAMFDAWLADGVARADGNAELRRTFGKDVLPSIGATPLRAVTSNTLLGVLRAIGRQRARGRTAERMLSELRQMYRWAIKRNPWRGLLTEGNPAELIETAHVVPADYTPGIRTRTLSADEIRELRSIFATMQANYEAAPNKRSTDRPVLHETRLATWLCLSTACRIGELLMARWEHIDLDIGEWVVPKENTKTKVEWRVLLSDFALRQFKALHELTGETEWCFPARAPGRGESPIAHVCVKSVSKQIGDRQMQFKNRKPLKHRRHDNSLVLADGKNGAWTPHDMRRTAATMMQALRISAEVIDRCQNHVQAGSKVRRHYLHHDYVEEKREAWRLLGQRIEIILAGSNVVPMTPSKAA